MFKVPAPAVQDSRGRQGSAHYMVRDDLLDLVVDQDFLTASAYPVTIDPTTIVVGALVSNAAAPWQRVAVSARDGTQAMFFYNADSGSLQGIDIVTSTNDWASFSGPSLAVATVGAQGFSAPGPTPHRMGCAPAPPTSTAWRPPSATTRPAASPWPITVIAPHPRAPRWSR